MRGLSLERELPLLITALLLAIIAVALALTYREVRSSAMHGAAAALQRATRELAAAVDVRAAARLQQQREVAADPAVRRALGGEPIDTHAVHMAIDRLAMPGDSGLLNELWSTAGRRLIGWGAETLPEGSSRPAAVLPTAPPPDDSVRYGPFYRAGSRVYFWVVIPVLDSARPGRPLGWILRQRRVAGTPELERQIRGLIGSDVSVYFRNDTGTFWASLVGTPAPPATPRSGEGDVTIFERPTRTGAMRVLAAAAPVQGTPWTIVVEAPEHIVLAGPRATLSRLVMLALVLLVAGAAGSWAISRRVARPVVLLTAAAERAARGQYGGASLALHATNGAVRRNEIGRLADSFRHMLSEVAMAQSELELQVNEAQSLAEELEQTNNQLEEAVEEAKEARHAAESANATKDQFLAQMSHELRTPLNAIIGYTQLVDMGLGGPVTDQQRQYLQRLAASGQHLLALVNDVLDLAKTDAERMVVARDEALVANAVGAAISVVLPQAEVKGLALVDGDVSTESTRYVGDEQRVRQILVNLLSNAVKFTGTGGTIRVSSGQDEIPPVGSKLTGAGPWAWVRVADTGVGIRDDRQASIFEPFVQAEGGLTRVVGGTGLGLTISRRLARLMGGDITLESTPGLGSVFTLWLPASGGVAHGVDGADETAAARGTRAHQRVGRYGE